MHATKWEYHAVPLDVEGFITVRVDDGQPAQEFNVLGREGWELVSMFDLDRGHGRSTSVVAVFTRAT